MTLDFNKLTRRRDPHRENCRRIYIHQAPSGFVGVRERSVGGQFQNQSLTFSSPAEHRRANRCPTRVHYSSICLRDRFQRSQQKTAH
jgi:hypothetical protein